MKHSPIRLTTAVAMSLAFSAQATTYYWKPGATQGLWTSLSNWSTEAVDGADAAALPGSSDSLYNTGDYNFDLDGGSYTLAGWPTPGDWNNHYLTIENGSLTFSGEVSTHSGQINVNTDGVLTFPSGSSLVLGIYTSAGMLISANDGGSISVGGSVRLYSGSFAVASGGSMTFAPSNLRYGAESHSYALGFSNSGTLTLPHGFRFDRWDTATVNAGATYTFTQAAGTLNLGGPIANAPDNSSSKPGPFYVVLSGGTVNVTDDVSFDVTSITVENSLTVDVASGKTINMTPVAFEPGASITKTGAGVVALPASGAVADISAGGVSIASAATYDLSAVTFASGTTVTLAALGATVNSFDSSLLGNTTFSADLSGVNVGTIVFNSSDATLLAKVKNDLEGAAAIPADKQLTVSGSALRFENKAGEYSFNSNGESDILAAAGWGGNLPGTGESVSITGATTVATFTGGVFPQWSSIEVKDSATLKISADADLPQITLYPNTKLEVTSGTTSLANGFVGSFELLNDTVQLPVLAVATNATLSVPSGMKFKNVDFRLYGTVTKPSNSDASPVFGYADNAETSYFAFTADGGVFDLHSNDGDTAHGVICGSVSIVCPSSGGTVIPVGRITLRNSSRVVNGWADFGNWEFGVNNPTSVPFDVLVDGTVFDCSAYFYASGAAHLSLVNGACVRRNSSCLGHYFSQAIQYSATVDVGEGCYIDFTTGDGSFGIDSQSAVDTVTVRDGGTYAVSYNSSGWGTGVFVSDGGVLGVTKLYKSSSSVDPRVRTDPLLGFGSVRLDGDLAIASVNMGSGNYDWDRHTKMANIPFSGSGDVTITNGVPEYPFTVTMQNGASTATGSIKVAKADGDAETALSFADGAKWAGTVVAGNVALTNLTDGAAAATATFGALDLADGEEFPIRVWLDNTGAVTTNDMINVGEYVDNGGQLVPTLVNAALGEFPGGANITLGLIDKGNTLPTSVLPRKWRVKYADAGDGEHDILTIAFSNGTQIILR